MTPTTQPATPHDPPAQNLGVATPQPPRIDASGSSHINISILEEKTKNTTKIIRPIWSIAYMHI